MMSKTPRTDAEYYRITKYVQCYDTEYTYEVVNAKFAEQLETELNEAWAEIERLKSESMRVTPGQMVFDNLQKELSRKDKLIEQMREIINDYRIEHKAWCNHDPDNAKKCTCRLSKKVKSALEAAERGG